MWPGERQWGERAMRLQRPHNMSYLDTGGLAQQGCALGLEIPHAQEAGLGRSSLHSRSWESWQTGASSMHVRVSI